MSALTDFDHDETGKIDLTAIYDRPDPRDDDQTLTNLDYRIPAEAAPIFRQVIEAERSVHERRSLKLLDVGCSYGVNAAILKHGRTLPDLFRTYGATATAALSRRELIARDRASYREEMPGSLSSVSIRRPAPSAMPAKLAFSMATSPAISKTKIRAPIRMLAHRVDLVISTAHRLCRRADIRAHP